jgi:hypothetical protein
VRSCRAAAIGLLALLTFVPACSSPSLHGASKGDFRIDSATPVQALDDESAVIEDRLAVAKVTLTSTFTTVQVVPIEFYLSRCAGAPVGVCSFPPVYPAGSGPPTIKVWPGTHTYYVGPADTARGPSSQNAIACVNVDVDYGNTIRETDESNNSLGTCRPLIATKQLRLFYVPISLNGSAPPSCDAVHRFADRSATFIEGIYPVADVGPRALQASVSCRPLSYSDDFRARLGLDHNGGSDWRDDAGQPAPDTPQPHHDSFIGVFAEGAYLGGFGVGSFGQPPDIIFHSSIIEETQLDGMAAAQEMAHNFGWVTNGYPLNDGTGHLHLVPAPGYWVTKHCQMGAYRWSGPSGTDLCDPAFAPTDFMEPNGAARPNDVTHWVSGGTWDFLVNSLKIP